MINPFSGTKNALHTYESIVKPMFEQATIYHDVFLTEYAGHALHRLKLKCEEEETKDGHMDIRKYEGIILLGGDGILFEVLQALKCRDDWNLLIHHLKFGIIGCGTCNGLAASLLHARKVGHRFFSF
jgi:sphingosine kinase